MKVINNSAPSCTTMAHDRNPLQTMMTTMCDIRASSRVSSIGRVGKHIFVDKVLQLGTNDEERSPNTQ